MEAEESFIKFPKTLHLAGSAVVDDDESLSDQQLETLLSSSPIRRVIAQEKVDGSNVSVHFDEPWVAIPQKRSGLIGQGERRQYQVFKDFVSTDLEMFWELLGTDYCLFGEWLWCQHAVKYEALPSYLIVFDIFDKKKKVFLSSNRVAEIIKGKLPLVPVVKQWEINVGKGRISNVLAEVRESLNQKSHFGTEIQEGLYIRFEDEEKVIDRYKIRRATFTSGRTDFDTNLLNNKLAK